MTEQDYVWDVFIAHAEIDTPAAEALYEALLPHRRVFLDTRSIRIGESWEFEIPRAMNTSKMTVVMVSAETELNVARGGLKARAFLAQIEAARTLCRLRPAGHLIVPFVVGRDVPDLLPFKLRREPAVRNEEYPFLELGLQKLLAVDVATTPPPLDDSKMASKARLAAVAGEQLFAKKQTSPLVLVAVTLLAILTGGVIAYTLLDEESVVTGLSKPSTVTPEAAFAVPAPTPAPAPAPAPAPEAAPAPVPAPVAAPAPVPAPAPVAAPAPVPAPVAAPAPVPAPAPVAAPAPAPSPTPAPAPTAAATADPADYFRIHTLKEGELVGRVARQYKADPKLTESYNPELNFNRLRPGTKIRVPKTTKPWSEVKPLLGL